MAEILADDIDFAAYLKDTDAQTKVRPAHEFVAQAKERLRSRAKAKHTFLPWPKCNQSFEFRRGEVTVWAGQNGHGKALSIDTPIPTPNGWTTMGDLRVGDVVYDERGRVCNVIAATDVMHNHKCFRVEFDDGSTIVADADHRWLTSNARARHSARTARDNDAARTGVKNPKLSQAHKRIMPSIVTTQEIADTLLVTAKTYHGTLNHSIQVCGELQGQDVNLPIDPYVLGAWLGDGTSASASIACNDPEILDQISKAGFAITKYAGKFMYGITGSLSTSLRACGLLKNKHIPQQYLRASASQRLSLLQGLMDTDGCITSYGRCEFTSTRDVLAEGFLELCLSLGIKAKMIHGRSTLRGKDCGPKFRVTFTTSRQVFRLSRKLKNIKSRLSPVTQNRYISACVEIDSVPVKCIAVDSSSHLYLAGRSMIPTHNTDVTTQVCLSLVGQDERVCVASFEMKPVTTIGRMVRMYSGTNPFSPEYQGDAGLAALDLLYNEFGDWTKGRLWLYDQMGTAHPETVLGMVKYCANELGITHVFIDSLMKCVKAEDDYNGQKDFVDQLCALAKDCDIHIHLVHHLKKPAKEGDKPDKHDTKGSGSITDQVDNLFMVWRNKPKEDDIKAHGSMSNKQTEPDCLLICRKQRNYEGNADGEPRITLWRHYDAGQFLAHHGDRAMFFPNYPHEPT